MLAVKEPTPCGVMFDLLKKRGGITHRELADLVLSGRPLPSGRSPRDLARDRSWLSHNVVHAPSGALSPRYFCEWGSAATRILGRLKSRHRRAMTADEVILTLTGEPGRAMDRALEQSRQDSHLYRNAVERLSGEEGLVPGERAEALLVLFVAAGCSGDAREAVSYAMDYVKVTLGRPVGTPTMSPVKAGGAKEQTALATRLGLIRVEGGYVTGVLIGFQPLVRAWRSGRSRWARATSPTSGQGCPAAISVFGAARRTVGSWRIWAPRTAPSSWTEQAAGACGCSLAWRRPFGPPTSSCSPAIPRSSQSRAWWGREAVVMMLSYLASGRP